MAFTSFTYLYFLAIVVALYWIVRNRIAQNVLLVIASYVFYGWLTPWYCLLLASSTIVTYVCLHWLWNRKTEEKELIAVIVCVLWNLGMLAVLKYWNFWIPEVMNNAKTVGVVLSKESLQILIPIGISFYTLQGIGITIDAYRGELPRQSFLNVATFLSFFPKLIAGPFEKSSAFLSQISVPTIFNFQIFSSAFTLLVFGFFKKLVVAENIKLYVDQIFVLSHPSVWLLVVGGIGFTFQIFADFSAYTDIARGSARLLGIELMENFRAPYIAHSPSNFWSRWHISLSRWFRDYIYIPLGGSRNHSSIEVCLTLIITMCLSGMWHGATSNFFIWGLYCGLIMSIYFLFGMGGDWKPKTYVGYALSVCIMLIWTVIGWIIFRSNDIVWLIKIFTKDFSLGTDQRSIFAGLVFLAMFTLYTLPWAAASLMEKLPQRLQFLKALSRAVVVIMILMLAQTRVHDFIYVNF